MLYKYCNYSFLWFGFIWTIITVNFSFRNQSPASGSGSNSQSPDFSQESQLDPLTLVSSQGETGQSVQELLLDVYRSIGDPDGIYGCGAGKLAQPMTRWCRICAFYVGINTEIKYKVALRDTVTWDKECFGGLLFISKQQTGDRLQTDEKDKIFRQKQKIIAWGYRGSCEKLTWKDFFF